MKLALAVLACCLLAGCAQFDTKAGDHVKCYVGMQCTVDDQGHLTQIDTSHYLIDAGIKAAEVLGPELGGIWIDKFQKAQPPK